MTSPNTTPEPVEELDEILDAFAHEVMFNKVNSIPQRNSEAKAQLSQLLIKERINLLARIHCCDNEPENTKEPLNVCMEEHTQLKEDLENQLGEKS